MVFEDPLQALPPARRRLLGFLWPPPCFGLTQGLRGLASEAGRDRDSFLHSGRLLLLPDELLRNPSLDRHGLRNRPCYFIGAAVA